MIIFRILGTLLQVGGLGVAADGVRKTRKAYAPELPGWTGRVFAAWIWLAQQGLKAWRWIRREIFRRPRAAVIHAVPAAMSMVAIAGEVSGDVGYGPIPDEWTVEQKIAHLDLRSQELRTALNATTRVQNQQQKEIGALDKSLANTESDLRSFTDHEVKKLATDGLTREAVGLTVTLFGTVIAAFG